MTNNVQFAINKEGIVCLKQDSLVDYISNKYYLNADNLRKGLEMFPCTAYVFPVKLADGNLRDPNLYYLVNPKIAEEAMRSVD